MVQEWKIINNARKADRNKPNKSDLTLTEKYNHRVGNFELIFPFNKVSEQLAVEAHQARNIKNPTKPDHIRLIINEMKKVG